MKRQAKQLLFILENPSVIKGSLTLHRLLLTEEYTRLDFSYISPKYYIYGGWIRIAPESYLFNKNTGKKYKLIHTKNIPLAPNQYEFEASKDSAYFSLYFKPIPIENCEIDFIEDENLDPKNFNLKGILLNMNEGIKVFSIE